MSATDDSVIAAAREIADLRNLLANVTRERDEAFGTIAYLEVQIDALQGIPCVRVGAVPCGTCIYCLLTRAEAAEERLESAP